MVRRNRRRIEADRIPHHQAVLDQKLAAVTPPFRLVLRNGMRPPVPVVTVRIDRIVPSPKARVRRGNYALHIGRVLKVEHWDWKKKRPK